LDDWGPEDWLHPSREKVQALLLFFQQYFSYHPPANPALSDGAYSSMPADRYTSDVFASDARFTSDMYVSDAPRYTSDVFASVLEDAAPSSFMPDFQSSERDACGCSNRRLEKEINVFLQQVFPAVREAGALPEDQKQAAQKRRKIRQLLGLPAMGKGKKAK
jgi:hypothetical protein